MDIFRSRFYRINVTLLSTVGLWPYQKLKSWQYFQRVMCQVIVITVMMAQTAKLLQVWGDLDIMIECLTPIGVLLVGTIKALNAIVFRKEMTELLDTMKGDWSNLRNKGEIEIFTKYAEEGRILASRYTVLLYGSALLYVLIPMWPRFLEVVVPRNETRPPQYVFPTEYYVDPEEYYPWIFLHTSVAVLITMTNIIAADNMFFYYVLHVCAIFALIGHRLENLKTSISGKNVDLHVMSKDDDDKCHREIVLCIDQHYKALNVIKVIESSYSTSYLLVLGIAVVLLSISAVQLLINFGQVSEMIRLVQLNFAKFNHLLFNSWPCQRLIDETLNFRESIYTAEWYSLSERNKRLLRFTMLRSLQAQKITIGKIYVMSIENFSVVIRTSISYFTVFASLR